MSPGAEAVKDLHDGNQRQHLRDQCDDTLVVGEEKWQVISERAKDNQVEDAEDGNRGDRLDKLISQHGGDQGVTLDGDTYHPGRRLGSVHHAGANEVCDSRRRGNGHGKGDLVRDGGERSQDALSREILGAEPAGE